MATAVIRWTPFAVDCHSVGYQASKLTPAHGNDFSCRSIMLCVSRLLKFYLLTVFDCNVFPQLEELLRKPMLHIVAKMLSRHQKTNKLSREIKVSVGIPGSQEHLLPQIQEALLQQFVQVDYGECSSVWKLFRKNSPAGAELPRIALVFDERISPPHCFLRQLQQDNDKFRRYEFQTFVFAVGGTRGLLLDYAAQQQAVVVSNDSFESVLPSSGAAAEAVREQIVPFAVSRDEDYFYIPSDPRGGGRETLMQLLVSVQLSAKFSKAPTGRAAMQNIRV